MSGGENFARGHLCTVVTVLAMTSAAGGAVAYAWHANREKAKNIQSRLESDAPFLGLDFAKYEDRDHNGRLETYADVRIAGTGGVFRVTLEKDGSYRLIPDQR